MRGKKRFPNRLRRHRKIMGYTQKEVAQLLSLTSRGRLSEWENGTRFPGIRNLIKLSILYHTLIDELYQDLREAILRDFESRSSKHGDDDVKNRSP